MDEKIVFNETPGQDFSHWHTKAMHAGFNPEEFHANPVVLPISLSTTFKQSDPGVAMYDYSRSGNPTREGLERILAELEGGKWGLVTSSGLAATDVILHDLQQGDHIVCMDDVYGGSQRLMRMLGSRQGLSTTFVDMTNLEAVKKAFTDKTKLVWIETPTNPTMKVVDIKAVVEISRSHSKDIVVVSDNTFATPYFQRPLHLGADVVVNSLTKYINGHSDVVMGSMSTNRKDLYDRYKFVQNSAGPVPSAFDCYMVWRGAKTLHLRMRNHMLNGMFLSFVYFAKRTCLDSSHLNFILRSGCC